MVIVAALAGFGRAYLFVDQAGMFSCPKWYSSRRTPPDEIET